MVTKNPEFVTQMSTGDENGDGNQVFPSPNDALLANLHDVVTKNG